MAGMEPYHAATQSQYYMSPRKYSANEMPMQITHSRSSNDMRLAHQHQMMIELEDYGRSPLSNNHRSTKQNNTGKQRVSDVHLFTVVPSGSQTFGGSTAVHSKVAKSGRVSKGHNKSPTFAGGSSIRGTSANINAAAISMPVTPTVTKEKHHTSKRLAPHTSTKSSTHAQLTYTPTRSSAKQSGYSY